MLMPDDVIDLTVADVSGRPIDERVSVMVSDYTPIIEVPRSGVTRGGRIQIHVSRGFQYDILFLKEPSMDLTCALLMGFPSASKTPNETETKLNISLTPLPAIRATVWEE